MFCLCTHTVISKQTKKNNKKYDAKECIEFCIFLYVLYKQTTNEILCPIPKLSRTNHNPHAFSFTIQVLFIGVCILNHAPMLQVYQLVRFVYLVLCRHVVVWGHYKLFLVVNAVVIGLYILLCSIFSIFLLHAKKNTGT